jgi:hypothetical protein
MSIDPPGSRIVREYLLKHVESNLTPEQQPQLQFPRLRCCGHIYDRQSEDGPNLLQLEQEGGGGLLILSTQDPD